MKLLKKIKTACVTAGVALALGMGTSLASTGTASASPWDPHVALTGTVDCGVLDTGVTGLWLWTYQDGGQWFGFSGNNYSEHYRRDFWHVPYGGTTVHYDVYCGGLVSHGTFGLSRPNFGTYTTRNIWFRF